jgi:hypothetical protein
MAIQLNTEQRRQAVEIMYAYLLAPPNADGRKVLELEADLNAERISVIENELKPLTTDYLMGSITLSSFKIKVDGINKRNSLWGFAGFKGQMFFNMILNVAQNENECDREVKLAIEAPTNDDVASTRIKTFSSYVEQIATRHVESGGSKHSKPNVSSVPFFLSYFWQVQKRDVWPIYYTNSVNVMNDLNLWQPIGDLATDYITYKKIHEELVLMFTTEADRSFGLYDVEHVFWFHGGKQFANEKSVAKEISGTEIINVPEPEVAQAEGQFLRLPDSYVPPIVAILPRIARNEPHLREAAKESGTSLDRAFEKSIDAAFSILGYETQLLGQGKGRVPDGIATSTDDSYAILWDAKVRGDSYNMGTDDRTIKEYIVTQSRELKRRRGLRNIYYLVISSSFADDYDDAIRSLKMDTDVNEVCLVEADALVAMVDARMRHPQEVSLGPDGLQRIFSVSGVLSADLIREALA